MKLRKLLSTFLSVAMISTLVSAFSVVHAADAPVLTATAAYDEEFEMIAVTVTSSGLDSLAANSGNALKPTIKGIAALSFEVTCDNPDVVFYAGMSAYDTITPSAAVAAAAANISKSTQLITDNPAELVTFYYEGSKDAVANFTVIPGSIRVKDYNKGTLANQEDYTSDMIGAVNAGYNVEEEEELTLTATVDEEIKEVVAPSGKTTYGISGVVSGGALFNTLVVTVNDNTNDLEGTVDFEIGTAIDANDITFGLNIWGAPAGIDFSATAAASLN